jgi:hypothetical protein
MFEDREGKAEWRKLNRVIYNARRQLFSKCRIIEGIDLSELCPLASGLISNDQPLMTREIGNNTAWSQTEIDARGAKLVDFIAAKWWIF